MSLRFIYGRAGSGKSTFCLEDIKKKIDRGADNPLILLVPEQFSFQAEKNVLKYLGERGAFRVQVMSFSRMAQKVFSETGGLARKHMNTAGKSMLIYSIMSRSSGRLKVFGKAAKKQGFVAGVSDIITEFKRYGITPEDIRKGVDAVEDTALKNKLEDIYVIFSEFESRLHERYIDPEDDLTMLASQLERSHIFDGAEIWVDEFASFTPQEYRILEKLFTKARRINVTLCSEGSGGSRDNTDVFLPMKNTEDDLARITEGLSIAWDKPVYIDGRRSGRFAGCTEIGHLEQNLFSYPYSVYEDETKHISILRALNKYSEVEETARDIVRLCRDKGVLYRDIAVVCGDLEGYESLVHAIFEEYEIPFFIDGKNKIVNSPLVVLLTSALEIVSKNWSYENMFRYLKTGLLGFERGEIDLLENYVLSNGIRGKKWTEAGKWERSINYGFDPEEISEVEAGYIERVNETRDKVAGPLLKLSRNIKGRHGAREMAEALYEFMCEIRIPETIEMLIAKFEELGRLDRAQEYEQVWDIIVELLEQVVEVLGDEPITGDEFSKIIGAGFEEYEIGIIPPAIDQVLVGTIQRLRSHEISVLYIIGVNDGVFPAASSKEGILADEDRIALISKGVKVMKDSKSLAFEEQFLSYTTLTTADRYLRLSFPVSDFDGKPKRPSIIISRLKKVFPRVREENSIIKDTTEEGLLRDITSRRPVFNEMLTLIKDHPDSSVLRCAINWYSRDEQWKGRLKAAAEGFSYENTAEVFDSRKIRNLYGKNLNVSVSRLEKFVECPFSYFVQYGLGARERKEYKLGKPDIGTLMHESLRTYSEKLEEEGSGWGEISRERQEELISEIVDEQVCKTASSILSSSKRYAFVAQHVKGVLNRSVSLISEHMKRGEFAPVGYELSFGYEGDFPAIEVELSSGEKVSIIGKIDRADSMDSGEGGAYIRIVDYKSGNKDFRVGDVYHRLQLQLLVYLDAILTELGRKTGCEMLPAGILYFKLDDPLVKADQELGEDELEKKIMCGLKMSGLLIKDEEIIRCMDSEISGFSDIIPVRIKTDGTISEGSSSTATEEQFQALRAYVRKAISGICEEILEGNIDISPYSKRGDSPCRYCSYSSVCQFDPSIRGNRYRVLKDIKEEEAWELIEKEIDKTV
ncbi:MAG: ATP-dependent helicase [Firmicutes bacterium]|nr:ATP-dependent helicase [Bacillota bacterium]